MLPLLISCANTSVVQEIPTPVQNNIIKPGKPAYVIAPDISVHILSKATQESKLNENPVYMCFTWDDYIDWGKFQNNILNYIEDQNKIINYYEDTVDSLNKGQ